MRVGQVVVPEVKLDLFYNASHIFIVFKKNICYDNILHTIAHVDRVTPNMSVYEADSSDQMF